MTTFGTGLQGGSPSVLRHLNQRMVVKNVRGQGPQSKAEIIRSTGLSRPTVNEVVADLKLLGLLVTAPEGHRDHLRHGGRTGEVLEFNYEGGSLLAVDIGGDKAIVVLASLGGEIRARRRVLFENAREGTDVAPSIRRAIAEVLESAGVAAAHLRQAVISTPGTVDLANGLLKLAPQLPSLNGKDVGVVLELGCPTVVENEMRMAVMGERWRGAAQGESDVVYVGLGVGVGAGILIGGAPYRGATGSAGEIGYLPIAGPGSQSPDRPGTFESAVGARTLTAEARDLARTPEGLALNRFKGKQQEVTAMAVFAAAEAGVEAAITLIDEKAALISRALSALAVILDPSMIVIGGGLSGGGQALLAPLREHMERLIPGMSTRLVVSGLGDEASVIGALHTARMLSDERLDVALSIREDPGASILA